MKIVNQILDIVIIAQLLHCFLRFFEHFHVPVVFALRVRAHPLKYEAIVLEVEEVIPARFLRSHQDIIALRQAE